MPSAPRLDLSLNGMSYDIPSVGERAETGPHLDVIEKRRRNSKGRRDGQIQVLFERTLLLAGLSSSVQADPSHKVFASVRPDSANFVVNSS